MPDVTVTKGRVIATPKIITTKAGHRTGLLEVAVKGYEKSVNCFFNDPEDEKLHSFRRDDEVEIEITKSGNFFNGKVTTPRGSVDPSDLDGVINRALDVEEGVLRVEGFEDRAQEIVAIYAYCRGLVSDNPHIMESVRNITSDGNRIEETVHSAAVSALIQVVREGIRYDELVGATHVVRATEE